MDPRTVQPVASRYTDYTIPVHRQTNNNNNNNIVDKIASNAWLRAGELFPETTEFTIAIQDRLLVPIKLRNTF
jgi:hypothetical protein